MINYLPAFASIFITVQIHFTYTIRNSSINSLCLPRFTTSRTQRSIKYISVKAWNNIPHNIRQLTYQRFITAYEQQLLDQYT